MFVLYVEMFGNKNPRLYEAYMQAELMAMFKEAINRNCEKQHSKITKGKSKLAMSDEL